MAALTSPSSVTRLPSGSPRGSGFTASCIAAHLPAVSVPRAAAQRQRSPCVAGGWAPPLLSPCPRTSTLPGSRHLPGKHSVNARTPVHCSRMGHGAGPTRGRLPGGQCRSQAGRRPGGEASSPGSSWTGSSVVGTDSGAGRTRRVRCVGLCGAVVSGNGPGRPVQQNTRLWAQVIVSSYFAREISVAGATVLFCCNGLFPQDEVSDETG